MIKTQIFSREINIKIENNCKTKVISLNSLIIYFNILYVNNVIFDLRHSKLLSHYGDTNCNIFFCQIYITYIYI